MNSQSPLNRLRLFAAVLAPILALSGCKPPDDATQSQDYVKDPSGVLLPIPVKRTDNSDAKIVALFLSNGADPHQSVQAYDLSQRVRAARGYLLTVHDAMGDSQKQLDQLREAQSSKPHAVFILPVDPSVLGTELSNLKKNGAYTISLAKGIEESLCDTTVFSDSQKMGQMAGELIVAALQRRAKDLQQTPVQGRVVEVRAEDSSPVSHARHQGLVGSLGREEGIVLVHDASAEGNPNSAVTIFEEALRLQKQMDAVYAHSDYIARGVHEAALKAGLRESIFLVATDGTGGAGGGLEMITQNHLDATVHNPLLVDLAWKILEKRDSDPSFEAKTSYEVQPLAVTPKNLEETRIKGAPLPEL